MKGVTVISMILTNILSLATITPVSGPADTITYPVVSAHRGGMTLYPENTLTAFKQVRDNRPDQPIEFDVRGLKDGTAVIHHDATIDRTATTTGALADLTKAQWANVRINNPSGSSVPATTLDEVLAEFGGTNSVLVPELKDSSIADTFIEKLWPYREQVVAQAFGTADAARLVKSGFKTLQLLKTPGPIVDGVYAVGINHTTITQGFIDDAHTQGATVWAWTVDTQTRIDELMVMEVDSVMTNNPNLTAGVRAG